MTSAPNSSSPSARLAGSVTFKDSQGLDVSAALLRTTRHQATFELSSPACTLRASEVLSEFTIQSSTKPFYSGNAVISSVVNTGTVAFCEVKLGESWHDLEGLSPLACGPSLKAGFGGFLEQWHKLYRIRPEYKGIVADMHTFLSDLRLWLDQVELGIRSSPSGDRMKLEHDLASGMGDATTRAIGELFEKYEAITHPVDQHYPEQRAEHSAFAKRLLHPLLLCSPFLYRTFRKPLGYAGDYEMVNMICRDPLEGSTLFAKIVNLWFLRQPPAEAHRNRVSWLLDQIVDVTTQAMREGRIARILSVGCGPALEVQRFLAEKEFANHARFTLIDFNQETAEYAQKVLEGVRQKHGRRTEIQIVKKSVHQIMKEAGRSTYGAAENRYDFVYCAGLFDYLTDQTCRLLSNILFQWVAPRGLFVTTNVDGCNPRRLTMDYLMDWHLIYRTGAELVALRPDRVGADEGSVAADVTGVNVLYSVRKRALA